MWFDGKRVDGRICAIAASDEHVASQMEALRLANQARAGERVLPVGEMPLTIKDVSQLRVCEQQQREVSARGKTISVAGDGLRSMCQLEPIEPLQGIARHPLADIGCELAPAGAQYPPAPGSKNESRVFDISHIILHSNCKLRLQAQKPRLDVHMSNPPGPGRRLRAAQQLRGKGGARVEGLGMGGADAGSRKPRNLLFDVGCTVWAPPDSSAPPAGGRSRAKAAAAGAADRAGSDADAEAGLAGSARGPSLPLFQRLYARQCIHFDHMWGWEATPHDPREWWSHVPPEVRPKLTFINKPVVNGEGPELDPLLAIAKEARREDFVVLKLDIDTFHVERKIVREIMTNARGTNASWLIDELFFEYHFALAERGRHLVRSVRKPGWQKAGPADRAPLMHWWGGDDAEASGARGGSVEDALELMQTLRGRLGIRAHFWI
jgi:hypothetical protein